MTFTDKIAALPEMPKLPRLPEWTSVANKMSYYINKGAARGARLSLLLETVRAYTEAMDALMKFRNDNLDAWSFVRDNALLHAYELATADLRTLQAHLEGERP